MVWCVFSGGDCPLLRLVFGFGLIAAWFACLMICCGLLVVLRCLFGGFGLWDLRYGFLGCVGFVFVWWCSGLFVCLVVALLVGCSWLVGLFTLSRVWCLCV